MKTPRYLLRVSVKVLGKEPIKGLEAEPSIEVGPVTVTVKQRWPFLILLVRDFASETDAEAYLPRVRGGLYAIAIEYNIAFTPYFERRSITRPEDPEQAARNLARSFGQEVREPVDPVHGLTEEEGYTIFRTDENIRFLAMGEVTAYVSTTWEIVRKALVEGIQNAQPLQEGLLTDTTTALDLYLACFYETSVRARFLTLMTCLEVLAPITEKHKTAVQELSTFKAHLETVLAGVTEEEERDALEALVRELEFKKETSIRRRVRNLVLAEAPLTKNARSDLAKKVVNAYDLRGSVVHVGAVDSQALSEAHEIALQVVKLLLRARLGLAGQPPDDATPATG